MDRNYLALKKLKEQYINQLKQGAQMIIPARVSSISYMTYLVKV